MCTVCGCGTTTLKVDGELPAHTDHYHDHHHHHGSHGPSAHRPSPDHAHAPGLSDARKVEIEESLFAENDRFAAANRQLLAAGDVVALNLMSGPGAGKTTLLEATIRSLSPRLPIAVIEGDQETANDAERIRATGIPAVQINTGKGCHLDAHMVGHALDQMPIPTGGILFIENVGNLVCPAGFDLGEAIKVVILSVTEGDDKPLKYPDMFAAADVIIVSKCDLLPHVDFDVDRCVEFVRRVRPDIHAIQISARSGDGMAEWLSWLETGIRSRAATAVHDPLSGADVA